MEIGGLAALAVTAALCALVLKKQVPELALVLSLAAGAVLLWKALEAVSGVRGLMDSLARTAGLSPEVWKPVIKVVGIGILTRLAASVCRDAGEGSVAAFLETAGTALALFTALPLVETVFDTLGGLL
ncbi:MAG: SpoIIIAC/SpoIIIAD family protein [Clostridiales bacterium]|nr:SpoIIIAC/SpoIIIAD family protein [Clostridiales bacterium]